MKILCGIVTYYPEIEQIVNIVKYINQSDCVLIVDNTPGGYEFTEQLKQDIVIIINNENKGIAGALSQIMDYAIKYEFTHVITFDQDSIPEPDIINNYKEYWEVAPPDVGALTSAYRDKNTGICEKAESITSVDYCITSGFFVSVEAYKHTSGYDVWMFIDRVDWDICYSLKEAGYKIYSIPVVGITHEIGKGKDIYPFGKHLIISNHVPWRRYYMARNGVYLARKHKSYGTVGHALKKELLIVAVVFLYENKKLSKLWYGIRGVLKGLTAPIRDE